MRLYSVCHNNHAVSEIVGSVILLAIAVLTFSAIYLYVFPLPNYTAESNVDIQGSVSGKYAEIIHVGGESLRSYQIFADGELIYEGENLKTGDSPIIFEMKNNTMEVIVVEKKDYGGSEIVFEGELETDEQCDFDPPEIIDNTPSSGTTGDPFSFNVNISDDNNVFVYVNWSHGTKNSNTSLTQNEFDSNYSATITTDHNISNLTYFIYVKDYWDNAEKTNNKSVTISDNDPPEIDLNDIIYNEENYNISADITDNIQVQTVLINITYPDGSSDEKNMLKSGDTYYEIFNFTDEGDYIYQIEAYDGYNYNSSSDILTINIFGTQQNSPPSQENPTLYSSLLSNTAGEDLICRNGTSDDIDEDIVTSIYTWYCNNNPFAKLYFSFDTNSSSIAKDYTPPRNNGSISGAIWKVNGKVGGGYEFEDDGNINCSLPTVFSDLSNNDFSITVWINSDDINANNNCVCEAYHDANNHVQIFQYDGRIYAGINVNNDKYVLKTDSLFSDNWYHIGLLWDSSSETARLYINGLEYTNSGSESVFIAGDESLLFIGQRTDESNGWNGLIDEFYIYDDLVSEDHVYQQYLCTRDGFSDVSVIVSEETMVDDTWYCVVTPNDSYQDGQEEIGFEITIE